MVDRIEIGRVIKEDCFDKERIVVVVVVVGKKSVVDNSVVCIWARTFVECSRDDDSYCTIATGLHEDSRNHRKY